MREIEEGWRALRRADRQRLKKNRRWHWFGSHDFSQLGWEGRWARLVDTPTPCSCCGCGNQRRHFGIPSIQEQRANQPELQPDPWQAYRCLEE